MVTMMSMRKKKKKSSSTMKLNGNASGKNKLKVKSANKQECARLRSKKKLAETFALCKKFTDSGSSTREYCPKIKQHSLHQNLLQNQIRNPRLKKSVKRKPNKTLIRAQSGKS